MGRERRKKKRERERVKIAKVSHLGGFWVGLLGGWGGLNMAQQSHWFILFVSLH